LDPSMYVLSYYIFIILTMVDILTKTIKSYKFSQYIYLNSIIFLPLVQIKITSEQPDIFNRN